MWLQIEQKHWQASSDEIDKGGGHSAKNNHINQSALSDQSLVLRIYSSGHGTVNVPKLLSSLSTRVPRPSDTASLIMHETLPHRRGLGKGLGQVLEQR